MTMHPPPARQLVAPRGGTHPWGQVGLPAWTTVEKGGLWPRPPPLVVPLCIVPKYIPPTPSTGPSFQSLANRSSNASA